MSDNHIYVSFSEEGGSYFVIVDEVKYKCSYAEAAILENLLKHKGDFYTKEDLATIGWPGKLVSKNSVPVSIANLRKIFKSHTQLDVISNEKNKGYVVVEDKVKLLVKDEATGSEPQTVAEVVSDSEVVGHSEHVATVKSDSVGHKLKNLLAKGCTYPLLALNIVLFLFITFYDANEVSPSTLSVINDNEYVAVITNNKGSALTNFLSLEGKSPVEYTNFASIESVVSMAVEQSKPVLLINASGDRVVVDCLNSQQVISFSGDDLETIHSELEKQGCKI